MSALALIPLMATASPANAAVTARECGDPQKITPETSGINTTLIVKLCVERDSTGVYRANADFVWTTGGGDKFNSIEVHTRLEKYDVVQKGAVCNFTDRVNRYDSSTAQCQTVWRSGVAGKMTADATVIYDIADDGRGPQDPWELPGTRAL